MVMERPAWMAASGTDPAITYTAQQDRSNVLATLISREGVLYPDSGELRLDQRAAGANMSVDVFPGRCAIRGDDASDQGTYIQNSTTTVNVATFSTGAAITAPASGTRTHRMIARIRDKTHNGIWTGYDWVFQLLQDTGSGAPALPASAITLGFVRISAGQASIQTQHIDTIPDRASVGTIDRVGTLSPTTDYDLPDASRPLRWSLSPDGKVEFSGYPRRTAGSGTVGTSTLHPITQAVPEAIRPAGGVYRDWLGLTTAGPCYMSIMPDYRLGIRFWASTTLVNDARISLDNCGYRV